MSDRLSFLHRDFDNPESETCWLSCLFQSLWHSVVFHVAFEEHILPANLPSSDEGQILNALQETWAEYKDLPCEPLATQEGRQHGTSPAQPANSKVSSSDLAEAFGEGYGDMSEALAMLQEELLTSCVGDIKAVGEALVIVPVSLTEGRYPEPRDAWQLLNEWKAADSPLVAVDISLRKASKKGSRSLTENWVPKEDATGLADLGDAHSLVSLVCYMWRVQHYVVFCRRQKDISKCVFFNDLPDITPGADRELHWHRVPSFCKEHGMTPRLAFYESVAAARGH